MTKHTDIADRLRYGATCPVSAPGGDLAQDMLEERSRNESNLQACIDTNADLGRRLERAERMHADAFRLATHHQQDAEAQRVYAELHRQALDHLLHGAEMVLMHIQPDPDESTIVYLPGNELDALKYGIEQAQAALAKNPNPARNDPCSTRPEGNGERADVGTVLAIWPIERLEEMRQQYLREPGTHTAKQCYINALEHELRSVLSQRHTP